MLLSHTKLVLGNNITYMSAYNYFSAVPMVLLMELKIINDADKYLDKYIASTFGFVNYKNKKYTIGVIIIDPFVQNEFQIFKYPGYSSTVLFTEIVNKLTKKNSLNNENLIQQFYS